MTVRDAAIRAKALRAYLREVLEAEAAARFDDRARAGGLSAWVEARLGEASDDLQPLLRRLSQYSKLRPHTRRPLAEEALAALRAERPVSGRPEPAQAGRPAPPAGILPPGRPARPGDDRPPDGRRADVTATAPPRPAGAASERATGHGDLGVRVAVAAPSGLATPVTALWGVGETVAKRLATLGLRTVDDLLHHVPRRYIDRSAIVPLAEAPLGTEVTVVADVLDIASRDTRSRRLRLVEAVIGDPSGRATAVWFNQPYLERTLRGRTSVVFAGRLEMGVWGRQLTSPEFEFDAAHMIHSGRLVPVYPATSGITQKQLRRWAADAVETYAHLVADPLPEPLRLRHALRPAAEAVRALHFPASVEDTRSAIRRLAFEELLVYQLGVLQHRRAWREAQPGRAVAIRRDALARFGARLAFKLTADQRQALTEILNDLRQPHAMSRLLQGDVGSGKTVVAAGALAAVVADSWQGALMVPTEVLAEQHARTLSALLLPLGIRVELITGSVPAARKRALWAEVESGAVHVLVGTHALIQDGARFQRLNLAVVDEQHRFGVQQRSEIRAKGYNPHLLAMTATPIPRTLALTLYGDLDVSHIKSMPRGRQTVKTTWVPPEERDEAYRFVRTQVAAGRQAFIICPLIQESEALQVRSAVEEFERLRARVFADLADRIGLVHGRLAARAKDAAMRRFRVGADAILVSTAVVEVGIDVPNATVMMIEGAERFGLAQLHQLRGRVGRGAHQSFCLLLSDTTDPAENARLRTMQSIYDGFALAERDLELRGPGEVLGTRQSGLLAFQFAKITDIETITLARQEAIALMASDPELVAPEHQALGARVRTLLARGERS